MAAGIIFVIWHVLHGTMSLFRIVIQSVIHGSYDYLRELVEANPWWLIFKCQSMKALLSGWYFQSWLPSYQRETDLLLQYSQLSFKPPLCQLLGFELFNLSGNLVSSDLTAASRYRWNIHQERIDIGVLRRGEPEERLHGCGGVLVVRSRMGLMLVTLQQLKMDKERDKKGGRGTTIMLLVTLGPKA